MRIRILLPVLVAALGLGVLGLIQLNQALTEVDQSDRAIALAKATEPIGALAHAVALEYVTITDARRGAGTPVDVNAQRGLTDAARVRYNQVVGSIRESAPALNPLCDAVERAIRNLGTAREILAQAPDGSAEVRAYYDGILVALVSVAEGIPAQLSEPRLIELARSTALLAGLDRLGALQLDLVARGLAEKRLLASEYTQLVLWVGGEQAQIAALTNLHPASEQLNALLARVAISTGTSIRQNVVDGRGSPESLSGDPGTWFTAQSRRIEGVWGIEQQLTRTLTTEAEVLGSAAQREAFLTGAIAAAVVIATLVGATVTAVRISRRLRRTRYAALTAARVELPSAIANVIAAHDANTVRSALNDSSRRIDAMLSGGPDEIGELASAFGAVHRQALRLAADQALLRMEVQAMFVALSRRGQTLIQRQIHLIDEFSRDETDPDVLERMFALDHLAARMRRNEENLLVLAGGEPGRWITRPVALHDLLRAGAQEIEEYQRIQVGEVPPMAVSANVAGDLIHLLAELLENATNYSPPNSVVRVGAYRGAEGLAITVTDSGIGMPEKQLAEANERLAHPSALTSTLVGTMGLLVVARLAQRHGMHVRLEAVAAGGATATVILQERLAMPLSAVDRLQPGPWLRDQDSRMGPPPAPAATSLPLALPAAASQPPLPVFQSPPELPAGPARGGSASPVSPAPVSGRAPVPVPGHHAAPVPAQRHHSGVTAAGLPRRPADEPAPATVELSLPATMPDPETVRARLSSLASGIAAANEGAPSPYPSTPDTAEARMAP